MSLSDKIETTRENIISMIVCRYDYGHANQITDHFFWELLGEKLSDVEILDYASSFDPLLGYTQEDIDNAIENLTEWRKARK